MNDLTSIKALRRGLLEFAVLATLSNQRLYAADILARLKGTHFATHEGTLYPLLGRLQREGVLEHEWEESGSGPPRKYYQLTSEGRARLTSLNSSWHELTTTLETLGRTP